MQICRLRWRGLSESNTLGQTGIPPVAKGRILCRSVPGCHRCEVLAFGRAGSSAITTSRLEGLTSGLRIAHATVPLYAVHSRCPRRIGGEGEGLNLTRLFLLWSGYRLTGRALRHSRSVTSPYSWMFCTLRHLIRTELTWGLEPRCTSKDCHRPMRCAE